MLITDLEVGGAPLFVRDLACGLDASRFEVRVACLAGVGPVAQELRARSIRTYCLGAKGWWDVRVFYRLAGLIGSYRPHIVHCSLVHANVVGRIVALAGNAGHVIATVHTAGQAKGWHVIAENLTCRLSETTVCVSQSVCRHVHRFSRVPDRRLRVIVNGIDCERFSGVQGFSADEAGIVSGKVTLVFVGRLDPVKNIDILLHAVAQLRGKGDPQLVIIGDGPLRASLERQTAQLGLTDRAWFMGCRRDVERWLKTADIFVQPSRWEGMSLSVLEAMAGGIPIVAGRCPGLIDMIEDGRTGLLVAPGDIQALSGAIDRLIGDPQYADGLARAAEGHVRRHFSLSAMIDAYTRLYEDSLLGRI